MTLSREALNKDSETRHVQSPKRPVSLDEGRTYRKKPFYFLENTWFNCSFNKSSDVEFASETSQHHLADLAIGFTATASDSVASKESRQKNAGAKRAEYVGCVPMLSMY